MKSKIIDLFCGCGGLSYGFEKAGFEVALAIDIWKDAIVTYNHNHNSNVGICENIKNLTEEKLNLYINKEEIVGVIGGPPCQGYSTVGTRDINDPRNHLYLEYCRIIELIKPDFFVLENVKGLLTLNKGIFKDDIIERFGNLGYNVQNQILNASDFGIPQNRQRVFFIGLKNGKKFKYPIKHKNKISCEDALSDLPPLNDTDKLNESNKYLYPPQNDYQKLMREHSSVLFNHQKTNHTEQTKIIISMIPDGGKIKDLPTEYWNIRKYNKAFERMNSRSQSNTVDTGHRNYFHYKENRIPTVRENARLQSFPDNFEIIGGRISQYKQVGNAVPPLLAYEIAKAIKEQIGE